MTVASLDVTTALASSSPISSRRAAMIDANEAARRLGQAQLELERGAQPLPHERTQGTQAGMVNRYWRRQEKLQLVVAKAQHRWSETRPSRRAPPKNQD